MQYRLPPKVERPKVEGPSLFTPTAVPDFYERSQPEGRMVPPANSFVGRKAEDASAVQSYLQKLEAERDSLRAHPTFKQD